VTPHLKPIFWRIGWYATMTLVVEIEMGNGDVWRRLFWHLWWRS